MEEVLSNLPSKGFVYEVPVTNIVARTMCGGDEKILAELNISNIETKYLALLRNRIKGGDPLIKGIDPAKLTLGDRMYILLWQRVNSYSPIFKSSLVCNNCFEKINVDLDLTKIDEKYLPEGFKEPYPVALENGDTINLRLFRLEDEIKAYDKEKKDGVEKSYLYRLALCIVDSKGIDDRVAYLETLSSKDLAKIRFFHEEHVHGPQLEEIEYTCPKCQEVGTCALPFRINFLLPSGKEVN